MIRSGAAKPRFTLDTNLLVYSVDQSEREKQPLAAQILLHAARVDCWLMLQSLSEFYWATTRKRIMPGAEAAAQINDWLMFFPTAPVSAEGIRTALADAVARRASYWDALLIATAAEAGCTLILTEHLRHRGRLGGIEIHNPFTRGGGLTRRVQRLLQL